MKVVESSIASGRKETAIAAIAIVASTVQVPHTSAMVKNLTVTCCSMEGLLLHDHLRYSQYLACLKAGRGSTLVVSTRHEQLQ